MYYNTHRYKTVLFLTSLMHLVATKIMRESNATLSQFVYIKSSVIMNTDPCCYVIRLFLPCTMPFRKKSPPKDDLWIGKPWHILYSSMISHLHFAHIQLALFSAAENWSSVMAKHFWWYHFIHLGHKIQRSPSWSLVSSSWQTPHFSISAAVVFFFFFAAYTYRKDSQWLWSCF